MLNAIIKPLVEWYRANKRELPWRDKDNAYYTWVSQIMQQQTRVEAVKPYFERFIKELPDIPTLAAWPGEKLLKLWEGLGYYNRVRNMQEAALVVTEKYNGRLPESYESLLSLKGIGSYTAGAIASIAYHIPVPAVDGNVLRVYARLTGSREDITKASVKKKVEEALLKIMPKDCPGDFNQALMELGAIVCIPNGEAKCESCPVKEACTAYHDGTVEGLPVRKPKKERIVENRTVLVIQDGDYTAIRKREEEGLLAGLYELPNVEGHINAEEAIGLVKKLRMEPLYIEELKPAKHVFSHIEWRMTGYRIRVAAVEPSKASGLIFIKRKKSDMQYAIPSAFRAYAKYMKEEKLAQS